MEFTNEFDVAAPVDEVYKTLLDVERVAPNVPGAQVLETTGDDSYKVGIKIKLGPVTMQYRGDVEVVEKDEAAHTASMRVRAKETRGQGNADATSRLAVTPGSGDGSHVTINTDVKLSGKAAAMGGRMVGDVSAKMVDTFATNLSAMLAGPGSDSSSDDADTNETQAVQPDQTPSPADEAPSEGTPSTVEAAATEKAEAKEAPPGRDKPPLREAPRPAPAPAAESELNALDLAGSVIAGRLSDPKALGLVVGAAFAVGFVL